jgi:hypothetical protein
VFNMFFCTGVIADWDTAFADQAYHQQVEVLAQQQVWSIDVVRLVEGCL